MKSLQLQDEFAPYYATRGAKPEKVAKRQDIRSEWYGASTAEVRARLEACRERLARAIAAAEAQKD